MLRYYILILMFFVKTSLLFAQNFNEVNNISGINHTFKQYKHMGGGAVFFDYNNDGWEDLYITSGLEKDHLYKNLGNGTFDKITDSWLDITQDFYTIAAVSGDINNDGFRDLFVTTWFGDEIQNGLKRNLLFINNGNDTFTESGVSYGITEASFTMGAAMLDYNDDGLLDISAVNYVDKVLIIYETGEVLYDDCFPNYFYLNNGNNTFTESSVSHGLNNAGCALAVMPTDYDQDNDQDIYIANDFGAYIIPNKLFSNNFPNSNDFTDLSSSTNMDVGIFGMGIAYADYDKDSDFDYYITNLGRNVLIENNGSQVFTDISTSAGVENTFAQDAPGNLFTTSWGAAFLDVNNDTWPDLFVTNGRVPASDAIATGETDPNKLFINNGDSTFTDISVSAGIDDPNRGRGMAYSDYDKDGDLDVFVVVQDGSADVNAKSKLYQNQLNPNGSDGKNWVQFKLEGTSINKDAIGVKVVLTVNGEKLIQEVHGQGSHCSQHSLVLHFGLASETSIDNVEVIWSKVDTQNFPNLGVNTRYDIVQGESLNVSTNDLSNVFLYPNPTSGKLYFKGINKEYELEIYTVQGVLLNKFIIDNYKNYISIANYASGIYLSNLIDENGVSVNKEFIVKI